MKHPGEAGSRGTGPRLESTARKRACRHSRRHTGVSTPPRRAWLVHSGPQPAAGICRRALTFFSSRMKSSTRVLFLGQEDLLEKGMATYYHILAWRISWTEEPGRHVC